MEKSKIQSRNELEFAIFCIENTAIELNKDAVDVYDAFTKQSQLLYDYIIPLYDVLHTQSKEYIVENILNSAKLRGIEL